jgi:hypothetical protein
LDIGETTPCELGTKEGAEEHGQEVVKREREINESRMIGKRKKE